MQEPNIEPFEIVSRNDRIFVQLAELRETLILQAENIAMVLQDKMKPQVVANLRGEEQSKARHRYLTQAAKIETELNKLTVLAESFRTHLF